MIELRLLRGEEASSVGFEFGGALLQLASSRGEPYANVLVAQPGVERFMFAAQVRQVSALRLGHAIHEVIDALLTARDGIGHTHQRRVLGPACQRIVRPKQSVIHGLAQTITQHLEAAGELLLRLNDEFGSCRRCGCTQVGDEIADGEIGFVADRGDHRNLRRGDGAGECFIVKSEEVLERATTAGDDNHVDAAQAIQVPHAGADFVGGVLALYAGVVDQHGNRLVPPAEDVQDVLQSRAAS